MTLSTTNQTAPITETDDFIARALQSADLQALAMAMVQITGDDALLDPSLRPMLVPSLEGETDGLDEHQREAIRARALSILKDYRDRGSPPVKPLPKPLLHRMLAYIGNSRIAESRYDLFLEAAALTPPAAPMKINARNDFHVVIIGAGMSGLLTAIKLDQLGVRYTIIEKNPDIGGTWLSNAYPGCRVDIPSHFYSYSFAPNPNWPYHYSQRDHLLSYFHSVTDTYGLRRHIRFSTEVRESRWSEDDNMWTVHVRDAEGGIDELTANVVVSAVGTLSRPRLPDIPGRDRFEGSSAHTGNYDRSIELAGKRVAVIGTAATGVQAIEEVAATAAHLTVFQRSAHWLFPNPGYRNEVSAGMQWLLSHVPAYRNWYRLLLFAKVADGVTVVGRIDPEWPDQERSCSALNDQIRVKLTDFMTQQVAAKPGLAERIIPVYPPFADRIIPNSGGYLRALTQDNVELVTDAIDHIDERGIVDATGRHHELDVIIYATGFNSTRYLEPMDFIGMNGKSLIEFWNGEPRAHLGMTVPDFPNFFMLFGPGMSSGNMIVTSEMQIRYILDAIEMLAGSDAVALNCRKEAYDRYNAFYRQEIAHLACSGSSVNGWWKGPMGEVLTYLPFEVSDYWQWTRRINRDDFEIVTSEVEAAA